LAAIANWLCSVFQTFHLRILHEQPMQHALVEILDIGNTGISLTDYAPMHRIDGVDYWKPMPYKAHEPHRRAQAGLCQGLSVKVRSFRHTSSGRRR